MTVMKNATADVLHWDLATSLTRDVASERYLVFRKSLTSGNKRGVFVSSIECCKQLVPHDA